MIEAVKSTTLESTKSPERMSMPRMRTGVYPVREGMDLYRLLVCAVRRQGLADCREAGAVGAEARAWVAGSKRDYWVALAGLDINAVRVSPGASRRRLRGGPGIVRAALLYNRHDQQAQLTLHLARPAGVPRGLVSCEPPLRFIHAQQGLCVVEVGLTDRWRTGLTTAFPFVGVQG